MGAKRVVQEGMKVTAIRETAGPPATVVHVDVDHHVVEREVGWYGKITRAEVQIPQEEGGKVRWERESMLQTGERLNRDRQVVETFSAAHRGPSDAERFGVRVELQTESGMDLTALNPKESYEVHERSTGGASDKQEVPRPGE